MSKSRELMVPVLMIMFEGRIRVRTYTGILATRLIAWLRLRKKRDMIP